MDFVLGMTLDWYTKLILLHGKIQKHVSLSTNDNTFCFGKTSNNILSRFLATNYSRYLETPAESFIKKKPGLHGLKSR